MIEAMNLVKRHGEATILRGVSLSVKRGEVAAIIGPSGCGKSTFLRCLNGLERFQSGAVRVGDTILNAADTEERREQMLRRIRRDVGMVFQGFHLFPHLSVVQNVVEAPIRVLGLSPEAARLRARALLDRVGLAERLDARPGSLSGGQQQRVAIARTLAMEPKCILFDEPTSALDPLMTAEVLAVIADLARSGQTMIVVTHVMEFARQVAHSVHVFDQGIIAESGLAEDVFRCPQTKSAQSFLSHGRVA